MDKIPNRHPMFGAPPEDGVLVEYRPKDGSAEDTHVPGCGVFSPGVPRRLPADKAAALAGTNKHFWVIGETVVKSKPKPEAHEKPINDDKAPAEKPEPSKFSKKRSDK